MRTSHSYLSADYERNIFNVSACTWQEGAEPNIVTIPSRDGNTGSPSSDDPSSSGSNGSSNDAAAQGGKAKDEEESFPLFDMERAQGMGQ